MVRRQLKRSTVWLWVMINKHILRQLETIPELTEKNVQIIACAGSGKTEFIAHRIAYLIATGKAAAEKTVAFTFTERAGRELKERIREKTAALTGTGHAAVAVFAGTIHSYCFELLKKCVPEFSKFHSNTNPRNMTGLLTKNPEHFQTQGSIKNWSNESR